MRGLTGRVIGGNSTRKLQPAPRLSAKVHHPPLDKTVPSQPFWLCGSHLTYSGNCGNIWSMTPRLCRLPKNQSCFLFGARGSGKTTLLHHCFSPRDTLFIDLLDLKLYHELSLQPERFLAIIQKPEHQNKRVVVDEIQKLPILLNVVHQQIHQKKRQFILTGSSSRRLKQKGTNLLAGRAWVYNLYPFSSLELKQTFDLQTALQRGGLPEAYTAPHEQAAHEYLYAYTGTYLEKEIQAEQWVRKLAPFQRFLSVAAQMNGHIINHTKIAADVGVDASTVAHYFEILYDTLLAVQLPAFHQSVRKAQKKSPKFYFVDTGIARALARTLSVELLPQTSAFGEAFEHWFVLEVLKLITYHRLDWQVFYLRTRDDVEVDLVIQKPTSYLLIEIKSATRVSAADAKALEKLGPSIDPKAEKILASRDNLEQKFGSTHAMHWQQALKHIFSHS